MGFFKDLFGPLRPCDVCQLGKTGWPRNRTAVVDWTFNGGGLSAHLRICPTCAQEITTAGLREKNPVLALPLICKAGHGERAPVHAYLQHGEWRKVWMHSMELAGIVVNDEFQALSAMKTLEARIFSDGDTTLKTESREEPVDDGVEQDGVDLYRELNAAISSDRDIRDLHGLLQAAAPEDERLTYFDFYMWAFLLFAAMLALREQTDEGTTNAIVFRAYMLLVDTRPTRERREKTAKSLDGLLNSFLKEYSSAPDPEAALVRVSRLACRMISGTDTELDRVMTILGNYLDRFTTKFRRIGARRSLRNHKM